MSEEETDTTPIGRWPLPITDAMLEESPYRPLDDPAESVAERLFMLAHLAFDANVWGVGTGRLPRYWEKLGEHADAACSQPTVATWWEQVMRELPGVALTHTGILHEKNLLIRPANLHPAVPDEDVMAIFRTHALELRDRTKLWAKTRRENRSSRAETPVVDDTEVID